MSLTTHPPAQQIGFLLREIVELPSLRADPRAHWDGGSFLFAALRHQIDKTAHSFADHAGPIESANMYVFRLIIVRYVLLGGALPSLLRYRNFLFSFRFSGSDITQRLKIPVLRYDLPEKYSALRSNRSVPPIESALHSRIRRSNKALALGASRREGALEHSVCTEASLDGRDARGLRVLVVSDVCWVREALAMVLKADPAISSVELSADLVGALALNPVMMPDAVLLDATLPRGHSEVRRSREIAPNAPPIIAFGVRQTKDEVIAWAEAGVTGYIANTISQAEFVPIVKAILAGEQACSGQVVAELLRRIAALASVVEGRQYPSELALTERERQIAELITGGLSDKEIARRLNMSLPTVKLHVHHLLGKLNVQRRSQVILRLHGLNILSH